MSKTAIIILSDPTHGSDEALGRCFNALALAYDLKRGGQQVEVIFQGAGTRWTGPLFDPEHPVHALFQSVADTVRGVSRGCSDVFGARADAERSGLELLSDNAVPGTPGIPSLARLLADGFTVVTF